MAKRTWESGLLVGMTNAVFPEKSILVERLVILEGEKMVNLELCGR